MKTPFLLCILLVTITFFSCKNDDDAINNSIVGTWKLAAKNDGDGVPINLLDCEKNTIYTITDNTFSVRDFEANQDRTDCLPVEENASSYRTNGNKIEFLNSQGDIVVSDESEFTFSVAADKLEIIDTDPSIGKVVIEMSFDRQ